MKKTKELAIELGFIRTRSPKKHLLSSNKRQRTTKQIFEYLIVLDYESTCWQEKYRTQEIIEFPAVLLNTSTGVIENEFHYYVQPQEQPILSEFCKQLTGITQAQVENGIPIHICLKKFSHWLDSLYKTKNIVFQPPKNDKEKYCTLVTWSDWDLGTCLYNECRRKQIRRPSQLNAWIDLRATYRKFYDRRPNGLNGALQDLGIEFKGREHSGLHDARNTAQLAWRMINDGCVMNITKTIHGRNEVAQVQVIPRQKQLSPTKSPAPKLQKPNIHTDLNNKENTAKALTPKKTKPSKIPVSCERGSPKCSKLNPYQIPTKQSLLGHNIFCESASIGNDTFVTKAEALGFTPKTGGLRVRNPNISAVKEKYLNQNGKLSTSTTNISSPFLRQSYFKSPNSDSAKIKRSKETQSKSLFKTPVNFTNSSAMKVTPPLCKCGKRGKRRMVQSPGPNLGRFFFSCGNSHIKDGKRTGCGFFSWESTGINSNKMSTRSRSFTAVSNRSTVQKPFTPVFDTYCSLQTGYKKNLGIRQTNKKPLR